MILYYIIFQYIFFKFIIMIILFVFLQAKIIVERTYEELQTTTDLNFLKNLQSPTTPDNQSIFINNGGDFNVSKRSICNRKISATSNVSLLCDSKENTNQGEQEKIVEIRSSGNISWDTYLSYFLNGGNVCKLLYLIFSSILFQTASSCVDLWITYWYF